MVNFIFYIGALVCGMCFLHPAFLGCSFFLSLAYYVTVKKRWTGYLARMAVLFIGLSVINPLFNTLGETVLFTYFGNRPYTFEALCYGMAVGAMFVTILTWFGTYSQVMTSDKFLYCFGRLAPAVSLVLTMVLRMVPSFRKKAGQIGGARRCIGKSVEDGSNYEKIEHGMTIVSALTSWALEGGVIMADSMRSRGYGTGKRTAFSIYRVDNRDRGLVSVFFWCLTGIMMAVLFNQTRIYYDPQIVMNRITVVSYVFY